MSEEQLNRAKIEPIPEGEPRPLWSVMIPTYNCANYLRETLASVLAQDPGPEIMQIEVVDDCSTQDDAAAVVQELGKERVGFYRQEKNVGYIRNFETCLQRSRGHLLHILHGDDGVRDGFYHKLQQGFLEHPEIGAAYCRHIFMDENGHWQRISQLEQAESGILNNALERIAVRHPIQTPSIAVRRAVYEELGGFDRRISCSGEDWEMWVRIAARYPIWYEVEPLATYRTGITSLSGKAVRTGKDMQDVRKAYEMILPYLPPERARELSVKIRDFWAFSGLANAVKFVNQGEFSSMTAQIREAIEFKPSLKFFFVSVFYLSIAGAKYLTKQTDVEKMFLDADNKKVNSNFKAS